MAKKFRISDNLKPYPSLALGCVEATLLESVGAFNVFANNGTYIEPHFLRWIKDEWGTKIWKFEAQKENVISYAVCSQVTRVLSIGVKRYFERLENKDLMCQAIGKTGTTNQSRTGWFCGATPTLTTAIYAGSDDNKSMGNNIYPVRTVFPIWFAMYQNIESDKKSFNFDSNLREIKINWHTGDLLDFNDNTPGSVSLLVT